MKDGQLFRYRVPNFPYPATGVKIPLILSTAAFNVLGGMDQFSPLSSFKPVSMNI